MDIPATPAPETATPPPSPPQTPPPPATPQTAQQINAPQIGHVEPAAPPPAAKIIVEAKRTERELELEAEREELRQKYENEATARRKAETDAAYHADEARRLKELQSGPAPAPKPKRVRSFMGFTQEITDED